MVTAHGLGAKGPLSMMQPEALVGGEWAEWCRLTPAQRWLESEKLCQPISRSEDRLNPNPIRQVLSSMRVRVDVMSIMRGVDPFDHLWKRRTALELPGGEPCNLLSLPDLVQAKKTPARQGLADDSPAGRGPA